MNLPEEDRDICPDPSEKLLLREKIILFLAATLFATLALHTTLGILNNANKLVPQEHASEVIVFYIRVEGAIHFPGWYQVERGSTLGALMERVGPLPDADLSRLDLEAPITSARKVKVPARKKAKKGR